MTDRPHDEECGQPDAPEPGCPCWCHFDPLVYGKERDYPAAQPREEPNGHDATDPNAPLGWQCGDPACREHGAARFAQHHATERPDPDLRAALKWALDHIEANEIDGHSYCDTQAGEGWPCNCGYDDNLDKARSALLAATERPRTDGRTEPPNQDAGGIPYWPEDAADDQR